jgi:hypothetical protein
MFAAGYSAKVTKENEQDMVAVFQDFTQADLFSFNALQGEVWGGRIGFECHFYFPDHFLFFLPISPKAARCGIQENYSIAVETWGKYYIQI